MSLTEMESYRRLILENIEYDFLKRRFGTYGEDLDEIVELLVAAFSAFLYGFLLQGAVIYASGRFIADSFLPAVPGKQKRPAFKSRRTYRG